MRWNYGKFELYFTIRKKSMSRNAICTFVIRFLWAKLLYNLVSHEAMFRVSYHWLGWTNLYKIEQIDIMAIDLQGQRVNIIAQT